jgi:hypothetical protein
LITKAICMSRSFLFNLVVLAIFATSPDVSGQALYIGSEQLVSIQPATPVTIIGNLRNQGSLHNQGTLYLGGNWRNEGTYRDTLASEVVLSGENQAIDHRGQAFHHLSTRGAGTKELLSTTRVIDTLTLNEGILQSSGAASLVLASTATVAGGSAEAYVASSMIYRGSGPRRFPLGQAGVYTPLILTNVVGQEPALRVSVVAPNPVNRSDQSLARVSAARYWRIETVSGTYAGSPVTLVADQRDGLDDLVGAVIAQSPEPEGPFASLGQAKRSGDAPPGTVTSEGLATQPIVAVGVTSRFSVDNRVLVPSAFAPDAPNPTNRTVRIYARTLRAESFLFRIFDRWGTLVYQTASLPQAQEQGWGGEYSSDRAAAPAGVYQYSLRGLFENGSPVSQSGTITLFR